MTHQIFYFDIKHAIKEHHWIIEHSGGLPGNKEIHLLESVLNNIQNDLYYPTFIDKLTHLVFSVNKFHPFNDGNKRSSLVLGAYFLELNGYGYCVNKFIVEMENIVVWLADNKINKDLLLDIIQSLIEEVELNESTKLKLINSIGFS
ncbi:MAG: type II toxin-antitoxin system death-on-curing family toxin [Arcobacter sp.]|nr:MAG: type II toxin-antitoxin system death-on-curing family toxin [Arcobacter sp.]